MPVSVTVAKSITGVMSDGGGIAKMHSPHIVTWSHV
jgi:hypothetical protein